jgi:hypothetical protein
MAIITKPSISKGSAAIFSLSKSELLQHPMVVADSYFSDSQNWYRINAVYKSSEGSQYEIVEFDASAVTPIGSFLVSTQARDSFEIQKLLIIDFDGGFLEIPRSQLAFADLDVSFISAFFTVDFSQDLTSLNSSIGNGASISDGMLNLISSGFFSFPVPADPFSIPGMVSYRIRAWIDLEHNALAQESDSNFLLIANPGFRGFQFSEQDRSRGYIDTIEVISFQFSDKPIFSVYTTMGNFKIKKIEFFKV